MDIADFVWRTTVRLADFRNGEAAFRDALKGSDIRLAAAVILLAGIYSVCVSTLVSVLTLYVDRYFYVFNGYAVPEIEITLGLLWPYIAYFGGFVLPVGLFTIVIEQGAAYQMIRILGGKGAFGDQLYIYSFLSLAMALGSTGMLLAFFPCIGFLALLSLMLLITIYVPVYLQARMLSVVHGVPMAKALPVSIVSALISIGIPYIILGAAGSAGILPPASEDMLGIANQTLVI